MQVTLTSDKPLSLDDPISHSHESLLRLDLRIGKNASSVSRYWLITMWCGRRTPHYKCKSQTVSIFSALQSKAVEMLKMNPRINHQEG
jgi:hypothetical protein